MSVSSSPTMNLYLIVFLASFVAVVHCFSLGALIDVVAAFPIIYHRPPVVLTPLSLFKKASYRHQQQRQRLYAAAAEKSSSSSSSDRKQSANTGEATTTTEKTAVGRGKTQPPKNNARRIPNRQDDNTKKGSRTRRQRQQQQPQQRGGYGGESEKSNKDGGSSSNSKSALKMLQDARNRISQNDKLTQEECDTILASCVAQDEWDSVLDVLELMKQQGYRQEKSTYRACLEACLETCNAMSSQEILKAMELAETQPTPTDIGLTVTTMCCCYSRQRHQQQRQQRRTSNYKGNKGGSNSRTTTTDNNNNKKNNNNNSISWLQEALELVQLHDNLPISAYDAVLSCYAEEREWKQSILLLRKMEQQSQSSQSALSQSTEDDNEGDNNNESTGTVTKPALSTYRSVIECCVNAQQPEQAAQVLQSCVNVGKYKPTAYSFELVISAFARKLQWRRARKLLDTMDTLNVPKTVVCYNSVLSALSKAREIVQAKALLHKMKRESSIQPDVVSYNTVLAAAASTSRWKDALSILDECHRSGCKPDIYTYTNAIRACAKGGMTRRALSLFQVVKDKQLPLDTYVYTAVIEACAKAKQWKMALQLIDEMEEKGIQPSQVTYSVTITACGNGGQWEKPLELLDLMRQKNMSINLITYNAAITALSKAAKQSSKSSSYHHHHSPHHQHDFAEEEHGQEELWPKVMSLLEKMRSDGIEPDGFSFSSAISCCGAEGRWEEALDLLERMQKGGPRTRPNKVAYSAAISSCGKAGKVDYAMKLFRQMRDEGISADRVAYNALFSALRVAQNQEVAAYELWNEMVGRSQGNPGTTKAIATARADRSTKPDIITVTDAIAAISSDDNIDHKDKVDLVFAEAVKLGILLRDDDTLDSAWEVDLSGMSLPVARAACRFILNRIATNYNKNNQKELFDVTFITGVGKGHDNKGDTSLREYTQTILQRDFDPPLSSAIPPRAQGTVEINKDSIKAWVERQR